MVCGAFGVLLGVVSERCGLLWWKGRPGGVSLGRICPIVSNIIAWMGIIIQVRKHEREPDGSHLRSCTNCDGAWCGVVGELCHETPRCGEANVQD